MKHPVKGNNIVVIGSGIGGLSAGILLALLGYRVTVVEKNRQPGGLMRSYVRRGVDCPVGVHYVGALGPGEPLGKMFGVLGIPVDDLFYRIGQDGVIDRYIFDDFVFDLPEGLDAYERSLRQACPEDGTGIDVLMKNLRAVGADMLQDSFFLQSGNPFEHLDALRPMSEFLDELQASPRLRAILAVPCQLLGVQLADCPVIYHSMVLAGYLFSTWRLKTNGAKLAEAFVRRFEELGGTLMAGEPVQKIFVIDRQVTGVLLQSGRAIEADAVVAAIHPKAMLPLIDEKDLRASVRERISSLTETDGVIAVQADIDANAHSILEHNIYRLHADRQGVIQDGIFYQIRPGGSPDRHLLSIITRSIYGDWLDWEETLSGQRGNAYVEKKMAIGRELLQKAESVFGPLTGLRILDVFTPLSIRDYGNCPEGACYGVLRSAGQLLKIASLGNLPVAGLCLAGQNAMAPGLLGAILGSFAAAKKISGAERFIDEVSRLRGR